MAHIKLSTDDDEMSVVIGETQSGINYRFVLHGHHLEVESLVASELGGDHKVWTPNKDWYEQLTELERLQVFRKVLAEYRTRSLGEGGFKLAALGITESGDIYVSENTEQLSDDFHRQCAEQNMVTISTQRDVYSQIEENGRDFQARNPRYRDVYLMGGQPPQIQIACPCGNCTDLLSRVMDKEAPIWVLPVYDRERDNQSLRINKTAEVAEDLDKNEAWKTTIGHLNKDRVIELGNDSADKQRAAFDDILMNAETWAQAERVRSLPADISDEELTNAMHDRVATMTAKLLQKAARAENHELKGLDLDQRRALADRHIHWVRAATAQSTTGEWEIGVWNKSSVGSTLPSPEIAVIGAFGEEMVDNGIARMEAMECSPWHVKNGTMRTSPKAAIERAVKNRPQNGEELKLRFHALSNHLERGLQFDFTPREIFPSYFTGKKALPIGRDAAPTTQVQDSELAPQRARPSASSLAMGSNIPFIST